MLKHNTTRISWRGRTICIILFISALMYLFGSVLLGLRSATPAQVQEAASISECAMSKISNGKPNGLLRDALYTDSDAWSLKDLGVISDYCSERETAKKQLAALKPQSTAK